MHRHDNGTEKDREGHEFTRATSASHEERGFSRRGRNLDKIRPAAHFSLVLREMEVRINERYRLLTVEKRNS